MADRAERANSFQRETLLALQEALHDAFRLYSRAYLERRIAVADGANWQQTRLSDEVNEGVRLGQRQTSILIERISNDALRECCKTLMNHGAEALLSSSHEDAEARHFAALDEATRTLEQLGVVLRSHY